MFFHFLPVFRPWVNSHDLYFLIWNNDSNPLLIKNFFLQIQSPKVIRGSFGVKFLTHMNSRRGKFIFSHFLRPDCITGLLVPSPGLSLNPFTHGLSFTCCFLYVILALPPYFNYFQCFVKNSGTETGLSAIGLCQGVKIHQWASWHI